jgi:hypothetical protein
MTPRGFLLSNSKKGAMLLATLGDEQTQRNILGSNYERVHAQITGAKAPSIIAPSGEKRQADAALTSSAGKKPRLS